MRGAVTLLTISSLALAGCSGFRDSGANPANWFGSSQSAPRAAPADAEAGAVNPLIPEDGDSIFARKPEAETYAGTPIYTVKNLTVEPSAGGAIVKATGVSLRQGAYDVRLWPENDGEPVNGVLTYTMRAIQRADTPQGPERTRRVSAGQFVSDQTLTQVRSVHVLGRTTTATTRR